MWVSEVRVRAWRRKEALGPHGLPMRRLREAKGTGRKGRSRRWFTVRSRWTTSLHGCAIARRKRQDGFLGAMRILGRGTTHAREQGLVVAFFGSGMIWNPSPPPPNHLLLDLCDNVWGLKKENAELKTKKMQMENEIVDARRSVAKVKGRHSAEVVVLKNKLEEKIMEVAELVVRVRKQNMMKLLFHAVVVFSTWASANQQLWLFCNRDMQL